MFLYLGATPISSNICLKIIQTVLIFFAEELIKNFISRKNNLKNLIMLYNNFDILLGTAEGLSSLGLIIATAGYPILIVNRQTLIAFAYFI